MLKRFLLLNGLATIGVVMNHAAGWGYTALFWFTFGEWGDVNFSAVGSPSYFGLRFIEQLIAFSIAAFLVVSGFFIAFAARRSASVSWGTVRSRIVYLIVPYLLWSAAIFLFDFVQGERYTPRQYVVRLLTGGVTDGYYYVPMLCQMFLLSPLLVRLARWNWRVLLGGTAVILLAVQSITYLQIMGTAVPTWLTFWTQAWLFPSNLLWFTLGIIVGFNLTTFKEWIGRWRWLWLATAVLLLPLGILEWEFWQAISGEPFLPTRLTLLDMLYAAAVIFSWLAFENFTPPRAQNLNDLGAKSYGVYLANSPVLDVTARAIAAILPFIMLHQLLLQPILWVAGLGIPLLLMAIVGNERSPVRTYYKYIFG
ncbi:MAG: acyltransferase [Anaerolineae bacterium]|nr:acyltransferase [Anaerolineae bacterium]